VSERGARAAGEIPSVNFPDVWSSDRIIPLLHSFIN